MAYLGHFSVLFQDSNRIPIFCMGKKMAFSDDNLVTGVSSNDGQVFQFGARYPVIDLDYMPHCEKIYLVTFAQNEDSTQPAKPFSLISLCFPHE